MSEIITNSINIFDKSIESFDSAFFDYFEEDFGINNYFMIVSSSESNDMDDNLVKKRRKEDSDEDDIDDSDAICCKELQLDLRRFPPEKIKKVVDNFKNLVNAFNGNDRITMINVINLMFNPSCFFRWKSPNTELIETTGSSHVYTFLNACVSASPDMTCMLRQIKGKINANGYAVITLKFNYSSTMANPEYLNKICNINCNDKLAFLEKSKLSSDELESLQKIETNLKSNGYLIQCFGLSKIKIYIDMKTYKIVAYDHLTALKYFTQSPVQYK